MADWCIRAVLYHNFDKQTNCESEKLSQMEMAVVQFFLIVDIIKKKHLNTNSRSSKRHFRGSTIDILTSNLSRFHERI